LALATWGYDVESQKRITGWPSLVNQLRPNFEFFHDLSDFAPRNHHNIKDSFFRFDLHFKGFKKDNVAYALQGCAAFLTAVHHPESQQVVVESNHDQALVKWIKTADFRTDPENAVFYLDVTKAYLLGLREGQANPPVFEGVLRTLRHP
jgi:hypothetical protein